MDRSVDPFRRAKTQEGDSDSTAEVPLIAPLQKKMRHHGQCGKVFVSGLFVCVFVCVCGTISCLLGRERRCSYQSRFAVRGSRTSSRYTCRSLSSLPAVYRPASSLRERIIFWVLLIRYTVYYFIAIELTVKSDILIFLQAIFLFETFRWFRGRRQ
jgi:hypothetical protein